jgi:mono/diheme cytochrome c family protein
MLNRLSIMVLILFLAGCSAPAKRPAQTPTPARPSNLSWDGSIGALLNDRCASCHGQVAGLSYATYDSALRGSMHGPVIIPGDPAHSKLVIKQSQGNHPGQLSAEELARVKEWIQWGTPEK